MPRHAHDEALDKFPRYGTPTLFQGLTKTTPLFLSFATVVILWVELLYALLEVPADMFNWFEVRRVR